MNLDEIRIKFDRNVFNVIGTSQIEFIDNGDTVGDAEKSFLFVVGYNDKLRELVNGLYVFYSNYINSKK